MPVGNHVAEIIRQGILASLTGGFSYETSNGLLCNTVHMYLFSILMILPLLLGLFTGGTLAWGPLAAYCCFTFVLFLVLKVSVTYLHQIFDRTEPVVAFKSSKKAPTNETFRSPVSSFSTTRRETTSNIDGGQMIELNELNSNVTRASRRNTEDDEDHAIPIQPANSDDEQSSSNSSQYSAASSAESSANELLSASKTPRRNVLPADSLELISDNYRSVRRTSDCENGQRTHPRRKYSFPNLKETTYDFRPVERLQKMRKVRSTSDACSSHKLTPLPHLVHSDFALLNELVQNVSTNEQHNDGLDNECKIVESDDKEKGNDEMDKPCCSKTLTQGDQEENSDELDYQHQAVKRSAQVLHRTLDRLGAENLPELDTCSVGDLKGHITKFLEELIEKHPETLDAIENIRMNRLGRPTGHNTSLTHHNSGSISSKNDADREQMDYSSRDRPTLYDLGLQDGTHVAYDHDDTSQGAIHSFQDENGVWYTYSFDEQSSGTAKALGNSRDISEMFNRRRSLVSNSSESHTSQVNAINADVHQVRGRSQHSLRHTRHRSRLSEDHGHSRGVKTHNRHQKSLPTVPSNSLLDSQSLGRQSIHSNHGSNEENSVDSFHKSGPEDDSDSDKYILGNPTSIFHPSNQSQNHPDNEQIESLRTAEPNDTGSSRPFISFVNLASRLYSNQLQRNAGRSRLSVPLTGEYSRDLHPATSLIDTTAQSMSRQSRMALEAFALESRRRVQHNPDTQRFQWHDYIRLENSGLLPNSGLRPARNNQSPYASDFIEELQLYPSSQQPRQRSVRQTQSKINYYYRLKLLPKWIGANQQGFKIKLNRLSLTALFDRNNNWMSIAFDVWLSLLVTILASALISRGIYNDFSLFVFAFVCAGCQFSLLKSVQPDAASPVHGFNWLVCYSRPIYFCLLAIVTFYFDYKLQEMNSIYASPTTFTQIGFISNPHRSHRTVTFENFIVGLRDLSALSILLLPIFFTIGLLPQINTLLMHIFEQIEMHIFGGTATFSLVSSIISLSRSVIVVGLLCALGNVAFYINSQSTQNVLFSAFIAVLLSAAFIMSRWSSNPMFLQIFLTELIPWWKNNENCLFRNWSFNAEPTGDDEKPSETRVSYRSKTNESGSSVVLELGTSNKKQASQSTDELKKNESAQNVNEMMAGSNVVEDPLPKILRNTLSLRVQHDFFYVIINTLLLFALHSTTIFTVIQPYLELICFFLCFVVGCVNHYIYPQLRAHNPWKVVAKPILRPFEFNQFETTVQAKLMKFEKVHIWMLILEKTVLYPLLIANLMTNYAWIMPFAKIPLTTLFAFRLARSAYSNPQILFVPLATTFTICQFWLHSFQSEKISPVYPFSRFNLENPSPLFVFYFLTMIWPKIQEFLLKMNFILIYMAPWQISWGSAFHAFAQPFSVPHSGFITAQAIFSSLISAPLNPFLGSSFFIMSYVRPLRFWEKNYNTKHVDNDKLRLASQLDKGPMIDDSSLNSIFYEHLTRSLQQSLAGDLALGRWSCSVEPGDCFILVSLYLSCMIHIVELGNGFVTFQMRGLEFRGTYCHQREAEAISEDWTDGGGCCCCTLPIPGLLSFNNSWSLRSQAWTVTTNRYIIDGYSISDNSAVNLLQVHELRRLLVTFYVKCIIYYAIKSPSLEQWLTNEIILKALEPIQKNPRYVDNDQIFCAANDEDFDIRLMALSRQRFFDQYSAWISYCINQRYANEENPEPLSALLINSFCFALSILGRRALGSAANGGMNNSSYNRSNANAAESFLYGLHSLFKGDIRVGSATDEWVFADPTILTTIISPAVRMALKLHQDHFAVVDDFEELDNLYERIRRYQTSIFISHEHDPAWRQAIIANTSSLLALRHMYDESQDDYKIIMLNKMHLNMRVIKLNRECVRSFWSGQQQELIFLRNRNPERGSIQNARQVLRNMINSSADQPVGYPIYVSPLTTSFVETHDQVEQITGPPITFHSILTKACRLFNQLRQHFGTSNNSSNMAGIATNTTVEIPVPHHPVVSTVSQQASSTPLPTSRRRTITSSGHSLVVHPFTESVRRDSKDDDNVSHTASLNANLTPFEGTSSNEAHRRCRSDVGTSGAHKKPADQQDSSSLSAINASKMIVEITDVDKILPRLNEPLKFSSEFLVVWPKEEWRLNGGQSVWPQNFKPENGMCGEVVHKWTPFHAKREFRSYSGTIYLVAIQYESNQLYIPVINEAVKVIYDTETNL